MVIGVLLFLTGLSPANAELFDSLDAYPPRWRLDASDCDARITDHTNLNQDGVDGGSCEAITFHASNGSKALFVYPIEPVHPVDDLLATMDVMSARKGCRIGLRVRFPYLRDTRSRRPKSIILYGATYERPGKFETLGIGSIERDLRIEVAKLRGLLGADANLDDPYVDAIAINAYSGPGTTTVRLDSLRVKGMVPVGDHGRVRSVPTPQTATQTDDSLNATRRDTVLRRRMLQARLPTATGLAPERMLAPAERGLGTVFPTARILKVLEHQGEPLRWIRSLGFDAVLLAKPPTAEILREAIEAEMLIYAPPPTAPDPGIQNLLEPVQAWYLGGGVPLDASRLEQTDATIRRLERFPDFWRRPVLIAATEHWRQYATLGDAILLSAPTRRRNLSGSEQASAFGKRLDSIGPDSETAVAVLSSPPKPMSRMNRSLQIQFGAPGESIVRWQSLMVQTIRSLEHAPRAIFFRSNESLVSGTVASQHRSMALSYINRMLAFLSPWLATSTTASPLSVEGGLYRCGRIESQGNQFLILTAETTRGEQVLAGDGQAVRINLPPEMSRRNAWRLTDFSARSVDVAPNASGASIEIVSPDIVEVIVIGEDNTLATSLLRNVRGVADRAASDRFQLCREQLALTRQAWNNAVSNGATSALVPVDLLTAAEQTLRDAEPWLRSDDFETALRLTRRADAWTLRTRWRLTEALLANPNPNLKLVHLSCPPNDDGRAMLQAALRPMLENEEAGWSDNLIASGGLDSPGVLSATEWSFAKRNLPRTQAAASWVSRGYFDGRGAVRLSASSTTNEPIGGGYEGTIAMLTSPEVAVEDGAVIRVDAMVRTLGFGGPHQGLLVYDNLGGQEMGVLVRGESEWTPVRLYRKSTGQTRFRVMAEVIGDGEAVVDEVQVKVWNPEPLPSLPLRPID
jgi:hypothetical protein